MVPFAYAAAPSLQEAIERAEAHIGAEFIAGGTDMLQLLQEGVRAPEQLVDLNELPLADIEVTGDGIRIGTLARMAEVADNRDIQESFPVVVQALLASASSQVRNMATIGGNVRSRFRLVEMNTNTPCPMRAPGIATGILAVEIAMDELAVALGIDPLELRLKNYAERDESKDLPWSSKELRACYQLP